MALKSLRIFRSLLTPKERRRAASLAAIMVCGTVLEAAGVGLVLPVIAVIASPDPGAAYPAIAPAMHAFGDPPQRTLVLGMLGALIAVTVMKAVVLAWISRAQFRFAFQLQSSLSQRLFRSYMSQPWAFHLRRNSAELIHNVTAATNLLTFNTTLPVITAVGECLVATAIVAVLLVSEPQGTLVIGGVLAAGAWAFHRVTRRRVAEWGRQRQEHEAQRLKHLQQGLGGIKDISVLGRHAHFLKTVRHHSEISFGALERQLSLQQLPRLWVEVLAVAGMAGIAMTMVLSGRPIATVGPALGLFAAAAFRLMPAVNRVMNAVQSLKFGEATSDAICEELSLTVPLDEPILSGGVQLKHRLELAKVGFLYEGSTVPTLTDISLAISRGETVGIVGRSGAGKSTLLDLVLGLLPPTTGHILADGCDVRSDLRSWRSCIGYVPQQIYLTDDTLRRNIALGLPDEDIDEASLLRAIDLAQLTSFVASLPDGLDTVVGERGVRLSGGQRQRIGIARALLHEPQLLVLDEATSSLDDETEAAFVDSVRALRGTRTILIVAHRLTTLRDCDRIYQIEGGRLGELAQRGTSTGGPYPGGSTGARSSPSGEKHAS